MSMIHTIRDNMINTIKGKEALLAQYREDIQTLVNDKNLIAYDGEISTLNVNARFLDINIGELKRILIDIEVAVAEADAK